jgi:hypothetical protein
MVAVEAHNLPCQAVVEVAHQAVEEVLVYLVEAEERY